MSFQNIQLLFFVSLLFVAVINPCSFLNSKVFASLLTFLAHFVAISIYSYAWIQYSRTIDLLSHIYCISS